MASKNLNFTEINGEWVATHSEGSGIVQISRVGQGNISVSANIPEMEPVPIAVFKNPYTKDVIFNLDVAEGIEVTIKSATEVLEAKFFTE